MSILSVSQSLSDESRVFNFLTSKTCKIGQLVKRGGELLIFFIVGLCSGPRVVKVWFYYVFLKVDVRKHCKLQGSYLTF